MYFLLILLVAATGKAHAAALITDLSPGTPGFTFGGDCCGHSASFSDEIDSANVYRISTAHTHTNTNMTSSDAGAHVQWIKQDLDNIIQLNPTSPGGPFDVYAYLNLSGTFRVTVQDDWDAHASARFDLNFQTRDGPHWYSHGRELHADKASESREDTFLWSSPRIFIGRLNGGETIKIDGSLESETWVTSGNGKLSEAMSDGNFTLSLFGVPVSPIPEPDTWAMLLIGLGFLSFAVRNRKKELL